MRIILCGDALFSSRNLVNRIDNRIVDMFQDADTVFVNAEFATPERETPPFPGRGYLTGVRPETLDEFNELNMKLVCFANNHMADFGWQGVVDTINAASARKLIYCGIGKNLEEARKPKFLDTENGRIGVVACSSTNAHLAAASMENADVAARPGMNPLRWNRAYVLPSKEFEQMKHFDEILGTRASAEEVNRIEVSKPFPEDMFKFGAMAGGMGNLQIERGDHAYVRYFANEEDVEANLKSIQDAAKRSNVVIATIHTHEGDREDWYTYDVPSFIEEYAHRAIDAGATVVAAHGAHFTRGIEVYKGKYIFYNLGSILMEFEAGESMISPEMYASYGFASDARPSEIHSFRAKDPEGNWKGFYSEKRFSENFFVIMDINKGDISCRLVPIDLNMHNVDPVKHGLPILQDEKTAGEYTRTLTEASKKYGTILEYDATEGCIYIKG